MSAHLNPHTIEEATSIPVEVAYATADRQIILTLNVPTGTTAEQAVVLSNIHTHFPELPTMLTNQLGIFGKQVKPDSVLRAQDRVEIYRPLIADPKETRRRKAKPN